MLGGFATFWIQFVCSALLNCLALFVLDHSQSAGSSDIGGRWGIADWSFNCPITHKSLVAYGVWPFHGYYTLHGMHIDFRGAICQVVENQSSFPTNKCVFQEGDAASHGCDHCNEVVTPGEGCSSVMVDSSTSIETQTS